jgi:sugar lactone lactonase YvrE
VVFDLHFEECDLSGTGVFYEGLYFGEGPRWRDGRLWVSDFHAHAVYSFDLAGSRRTELELDDQPSGLGWLPDGRLVVVAMASLKVLRLDADGLKEHADLSEYSRYACNDMVVDGQGRAWVGNFGFDLDGMIRRVGPEAMMKDHPTTNLVRVDPDGSVHRASAEMHFPNGSVVTPDGRTLIVAESMALRLTAFDIEADGSLSNRRVWAPTGGRSPDGISLDEDGNIWVANPLAPECVLFAPGGEVLQTVETTQPCYACMLGGGDGRTLFMVTAPTSEQAEAARGPRGRVEVCEVRAAGAGYP